MACGRLLIFPHWRRSTNVMPSGLSRRNCKTQGKDLSDKDRLRLIQLSDELSSLGFSRDFRDPIEQQFADAIARRRAKKEPISSHAKEARKPGKAGGCRTR